MTQVFSAASPTVDPLPQEIKIFRDNNWSFIAIVYSALTGTEFDFTPGWEGWFALKDRDTYSDANILIFKRTDVAGEGDVLTPATAGRMQFFFEREDTRDLKEGVYFWDFGVFRGDEKMTAAKGQLELKQPILLGDIPP
jgi:hypothetical protein